MPELLDPFPRPLLVPFAALPAVLGFNYHFAPDRFAMPSFAAARSLMTIQQWGLLFWVGALVLTVAIITKNSLLTVVALVIGGGIYLWWGVLFAISARQDEHANPNAWALYAFIAFTYYLAAWRIAVWRR